LRAKSFVQKLHNLLEAYGVDGQKFVTSARNTPRFLRTLQDYRRKSQGDGAFRVEARRVKPILHEFSDQAGAASGHYFYQDLWQPEKSMRRTPRLIWTSAHALTALSAICLHSCR
jgi:hypothetical protein